MDPVQQVMSPNGQDDRGKYIVRNHSVHVMDVEAESKDEGADNVVVSASVLQRLEARLMELEKLESLRKEDEKAAKEGSCVFRQWSAQMDRSLTMDDLGQGQDQDQQGRPKFGMPTAKQMQMSIVKLSGKETYKGLGSVYREWGERFLRSINQAQRRCGFWWTEDLKIDCLSIHLEGKALSYFNALYMAWWEQDPTLTYAMDNMYRAFSVQLTMKQAMTNFEQPKAANKTFIQHLSYLVEVNAAAGGAYASLVLDSVVQYSCPELQDVLLARYNPYRQDFFQQAEEITHIAQAVWCDRKPVKALGKEVVNNADVRSRSGKPKFGRSKIKCNHCHKNGHEASDCWMKNGRLDNATKEFVMAVSVRQDDEDDDMSTYIKWIVDSGCSKNLVGNASLLSDSRDSNIELELPNGVSIKATMQGKVRMETKVDNEVIILTIQDVLYVPGLNKNMLSYGMLDRKDIRLNYQGSKRYLVKDGNKLAEVKLDGELLTIKGSVKTSTRTAEAICNIIASQDEETSQVHEDTLHGFHLRLGHLHYDAIERLAEQQGSDIKLIDNLRQNCLICAEGTQTRNTLSKKDSGKNAPTDRIGGVICSDLKGPITPVDRLKNRYVVNFIDYKTNYCRVFLTKTKDEAAKKFESFLAFFERRYDCRIQVLRTDGGEEYTNVDLFCQQTGVARQRTEANSPASNGKAERMNRTVFIMARCINFNSGLPMRFWGDAVKYAAYVLNRSPSRSNAKHQSPIQMLEGKAPSLKDIVIFGSPCMVNRDNNKAFGARATQAFILGRSEEVKGYVVYLIKDKKVTTTQHVKNIETLSRAQNASLLMKSGVHDGTATDTSEDVQKSDSGSESLTAQALVTKEAAKQLTSQVKTRTKDKRKPSWKVRDRDQVNNVGLVNPSSYAAAMKTDKAKEWQIAVDTELDAF